MNHASVATVHLRKAPMYLAGNRNVGVGRLWNYVGALLSPLDRSLLRRTILKATSFASTSNTGLASDTRLNSIIPSIVTTRLSIVNILLSTANIVHMSSLVAMLLALSTTVTMSSRPHLTKSG